jgi:hypothetical protein
MRYIALSVEVWRSDSAGWVDCCSTSTEGVTTFYASDRANATGEVATHSFGRLVAAARLRITVSASLRWIGHDMKCFRFELLGCDNRSGRIGGII